MIDIIQTISRYFRNITQSTNDQFITVQQEFDRLQDYTRIYQFMHGDHLKTVFSARETDVYKRHGLHHADLHCGTSGRSSGLL